MAEPLPVKPTASKVSKQERLAAAISHRVDQLDSTNSALSRLKKALTAVRAKETNLVRFSSHLAGFYDEIDKLAKGKALFSATDMILETANYIIRDSKEIIDGDVYIDRLKEFVPAGDNPVYPDILLVARTIQQATTRFETTIDVRKKELKIVIREAETIKTALEYFVENEGHIVNKEQVESPTTSWFVYCDDEDADQDTDGEGPSFDFDRLDTLSISDHLTAILAAVNDQK